VFSFNQHLSVIVIGLSFKEVFSQYTQAVQIYQNTTEDRGGIVTNFQNSTKSKLWLIRNVNCIVRADVSHSITPHQPNVTVTKAERSTTPVTTKRGTLS